MNDRVPKHAARRAEPFAEFYSTEYLTARRLAHLLTGRADVADDLAQEAMMRVRRHFASVDNPSGYLRTTVVNVCRNWFRSQGRERVRLERLTEERLYEPPAEVSDVLRVVDSLPYRQRAVVVLRFWLDLSEREIAEHIGCRPGTVKSLSSRAIERLRKELS